MEVEQGRVRSVLLVGGHRIELDERTLPDGAEVAIRATPLEGGMFDTTRGPDSLVGGIISGGEFVETARIDGRYVSTEVAGGMTGRVIGVSPLRGRVTLEAFSYVGADEWDAVEEA
jgi:hypothetical protein